MTILERLWKSTKIDGDCWIWTGQKKWNGYGRIRYLGKVRQTHRVSAHIHLGFLLESKLNINHKRECRFRSCWNPKHLYIGTQHDNYIDAVESGHRIVEVPPHDRTGRELNFISSPIQRWLASGKK